jgi:hypothetical protein
VKIMKQVPEPLPLLEIMEKYPVKYEESMNTVLVQEVSVLRSHNPCLHQLYQTASVKCIVGSALFARCLPPIET